MVYIIYYCLRQLYRDETSRLLVHVLCLSVFRIGGHKPPVSPVAQRNDYSTAHPLNCEFEI